MEEGERGLEARAVGEALLRIGYELDALLERAGAAEELTGMEARLLRAIQDPVSQRELAAQLGCDASRISILTGGLEARGLLTRRPSRGDKRVRRASPTPEGRDAVRRIGERLAAESPILRRLDDDERRQLAALLSHLDPATSSSPRGDE